MPTVGSFFQLVSVLLSANISDVQRLSELQPAQPAYTAAAISDMARAIHRQRAHVICLLRHPRSTGIIATEQQLLGALNAGSTPVRILSAERLRQPRHGRTVVVESCVYVLVLARLADFEQHIFDPRMGAKQFQWYFVVLEERIRRRQRGWLRSMFRVFWLKQVLNVVVIFNDDGDDDETPQSSQPKWFTYTPFGGDGADTDDDVANDDDDNDDDSNIWHAPRVPEGAANGGDQQLRAIRVRVDDTQLFANRLNNVHGSRMTVAMAVDEVRAVERRDFATNGFDGVDGRVADLIRERMNATFHYARPTRPFTGANTTGVLGDLHFRHASFGFNAQSHVPSLHAGLVEASNSFERHDICVLVPQSAAEPTFLNLAHTMTPLTWTIVCTSICLAICTYKAMLAAQHALTAPYERAGADAERSGAYSWPEALSIHFQSFFGDSICSLPSSWPLRLLVWCWCLYSFLITTAFTAKLISSLVLPRHLPDMDTLRGLADSPLQVIYPQHLNATLWQFLSGDSDAGLLAVLRDQMRAVPAERFDALIAAERQGNAYVMHSYMAKYMRRKWRDAQTGRASYHLMHECLVYLPKVYLLEKGSAYVGHVNELLGRFNEMGFVVQWEEETTHRFAVQAGAKGVDVLGDGGVGAADGAGGGSGDVDELLQLAEEDIKVVITVAHLQSAFYLLAVGLVAAGAAFAGELWWAWRRRRRTLYRVWYFDKQLAREYGCNVD